MIRRLAQLMIALSIWACTISAPISKRPPVMLDGVILEFDSLGKALNFWDQHIVEVGDPVEAQAAGTDYWYRLRNNSGHPISFRTASMYLEPTLSDWKLLPGGARRVSTLADGRRILILFDLEDRKGRPIPYGGDTSSIASLENGRSILFSVPHAAFEHRQRVAISIRTLDPDTWQEVGPTYRAYLNAPKVP